MLYSTHNFNSSHRQFGSDVTSLFLAVQVSTCESFVLSSELPLLQAGPCPSYCSFLSLYLLRTDDIRQNVLYFRNVDFIFNKYGSSIVA